MQQTDAILAVLANHPAIELAILFGSLARGAARPDSDLDLAVKAAAPLTAEEKRVLMGELADHLARPVDLVDLANVGEPLLGQILRHGRRLLGDDVGYARLLSQHVFAVADFLPYRDRLLAQRRRAWIGA
jgi:predicted nucleotidyltransferase